MLTTDLKSSPLLRTFFAERTLEEDEEKEEEDEEKEEEEEEEESLGARRGEGEPGSLSR